MFCPHKIERGIIMNKKIEAHVNALFANTSNGYNILDIKEELTANLNDKYDDLIASGRSEEEAFIHVISGIGDIDRLLEDLGELPEYQPLEITKNQQKRSIFISIGIALYVLSFAPLILFHYSYAGIAIMCANCAIATGFIVFGSSISRIRYAKSDNSFVEEYKEKFAYTRDQKKLRNAFSLAMWSITAVVYFTVSFTMWNWQWSWIIFLVGACLQQVILFKFSDYHKQKYLWHGILWTGAAILYFIISYITNAWAWTWMIFLIAFSVQQIIRLLMIWKN